MIGYDRLGTNGRFGNQLFQYAALRGIAKRHGYDWCIPPDNHSTYANYGMHHPFKMKNMTDKNIGFHIITHWQLIIHLFSYWISTVFTE